MIIEFMVGRAASDLYRRPAVRHPAGQVRLAIKGLRTDCRHGAQATHSFTASISRSGRAKFWGSQVWSGAGRTELARAIFGADPISAGTILIDGRPVSIRSPLDAIRHGIGLVPEDRKQQALFLQQAIRNNFSAASLHRFLRAGHLRRRAQGAERARRVQGIDECPHGQSGSGGLQPVRWEPAEDRSGALAALDPKVLIVDEPTRGIDVRCQGRGARTPRPARKPGHRRHCDLVRTAGNSRHRGPDRYHPGRASHRRGLVQRSNAGAAHGSDDASAGEAGCDAAARKHVKVDQMARHSRSTPKLQCGAQVLSLS